jgi:TRAP-type mannitol/chloroaromatic compound transport system permease small subunit
MKRYNVITKKKLNKQTHIFFFKNHICFNFLVNINYIKSTINHKKIDILKEKIPKKVRLSARASIAQLV